MKLFQKIIGFTLLLPLLLQSQLFAQQTGNTDHIDISKVNVVMQISNKVSVALAEKDVSLIQAYPSLSFSPGTRYKGAIPTDKVTKKLFLQFSLFNSADSSVSVYFFPGFYYDKINLYRINGNTVKQLPDILPAIRDKVSFRQISLAAHDTATIVAELYFVKTYINTIRPRLVNTKETNSFLADLRSMHDNDNLVTYVFCGLLLMMILFSLSNFLQGANPEFLYYSLYAVFLGSMLFTKAVFDFRSTIATFFFEAYLDFILQGLGIMFYMIFMQRFLNTREKHTFLYKLYNTGIVLIAISLVAYTFLHFFTDNFTLENGVENTTKVLLLVLTIIFLVYSFRHWKDRLLRYLFWGNLCLFVFSVISQVSVMMDSLFKDLPGVFSSSLFYYEIGLFLELVFFLAGLNYKNRQLIIQRTKETENLKAQNMLQEYEKEIAVYKAQQEERERISADMHDELGSGMTAIRLMSEIARNKMKENTPVEIQKISQSADEVLNKMNAIIWSMNSGNDTLDNLLSYIRSYCLEYFDNTPVECKVLIPENIPEKEITGDKRRNIFLCVKESLNNILKHSGATAVKINVEIAQQLVIRIEDNGKGIDMENLRRFGNGLNNIKRRMESINGTFTIASQDGTITTLTLPL
ncbi:MAG TPA: sensor histidine kinase [Chitinophagaceae bacterium]|nr:sensor histidine kinase [Chitinophagaceae bacterium]